MLRCCWQWPSGRLSPVRQGRKPYRRHSGAGGVARQHPLLPLIYDDINGKTIGLDYELAQLLADYLGVKLKVTVRQNINQLFNDLDHDRADSAAGLAYTRTQQKLSAGPLTTPCRSRWFIVWVACAALTGRHHRPAIDHRTRPCGNRRSAGVEREKNTLTSAGRSIPTRHDRIAGAGKR
ncbi:transporter substrate-binding domain-containing protein [Enterobacter hormaechei]